MLQPTIFNLVMPRIATAIVLVSLLVLLKSDEIIDFSYSMQQQSFNQQQNQQSSYLFKARSVFESYDYPQSCNINAKLEQTYQSTLMLENINSESLSTDLKNDFNELMKLSELIKISKKRLRESAKLVSSLKRVTSVPQTKLDELAEFEQTILQIKQIIDTKTKELDTYSKKLLELTKENRFEEFQLKYLIDSLKNKLQYLKGLQTDTKINTYRYTQSGQFQKCIDELLQYHKQRTQKISVTECNREGISASIAVYEAKLRNAKEIKNQYQRNNNTFDINHDKVKINQLSKMIKEKKLQLDEYCQGLKILRQTIVAVLQQCDIKLSEINHLSDYEQELKKLRDQQQKCEIGNQKSINLEIIAKIRSSMREVQNKIAQVASFKIQDFSYYTPSEKLEAIKKTQDQIAEANSKLLLISQQKAANGLKPQDLKLAKALIGQLKGKKATYCRQYEKYQQMAESLRIFLLKYKQETDYAIRMQESYRQQLAVLKNYKSQFQRVKNRILTSLG